MVRQSLINDRVINIGSITFYNFCKFVDNLFFCINVIVLTYKTWYCGHTQPAGFPKCTNRYSLRRNNMIK